MERVLDYIDLMSLEDKMTLLSMLKNELLSNITTAVLLTSNLTVV